MRVAVLGSNAFAGGDFVDLLLGSERFDVLGISRSAEPASAFSPYAGRDRRRFGFRQLDLNREGAAVAAALAEFAPDYIVNFAAEGDDVASWDRPADFLQTNCVALAALLDTLRRNSGPRRFLQVSSSSVYGDAPSSNDESRPLVPASPYGVSKAAADLLLLAYHKKFAFPAQIVRPPNLYGPYQARFRIVPKTLVSLKKGEPVELHGGGRAARSYLYVRDASFAMLQILERGGAGEVYNVGPEEQVTIRGLVEAICDVAGRNFETVARDVPERLGQQNGLFLDSTKIRSELGWKPQTSLRAGLEAVRDWVDREWEALRS